ncbi:MAG: 2-oxoacid:acceptor oxidoreductase family protein [Ilumatobacteraceae bacterium]
MEVVHRDRLDDVQRRVRSVTGVSAIVYDQTCAAEARRLRKRNVLPDPNRRVVINELVCEGCGDCGVQSNCIAVEPVETEFGRKRVINQYACNKDLSCLDGYCPSFAIVEGGTLRTAADRGDDLDDLVVGLPEPATAARDVPYNIVIAGIGGTGVVTVGAIIGVAAHLEAASCSVLDVTGLAQKNGAVTSHIRISGESAGIHSRRIGARMADLVLGCDLVVTADPASLGSMASERTRVVVNLDVAPTSAFASDPDFDISPSRLLAAVERAAGGDHTVAIAARSLAVGLVGDEMATNLFMVGFALQRGLLPVRLESLVRAIELNGAAVEMNRRAFDWGRVAAHDLHLAHARSGVARGDGAERPSVESLVARRCEYLTAYQRPSYAASYAQFVARVSEAERRVTAATELSESVARSLFKLMAYKDEYEVARLYTDGTFRRFVDELFEGGAKLQLHLAPQLLPADPLTGRVRKRTFGPWIFPVFRVLAWLKFLRGTPLDLFGHTAHRRRERALVGEYRQTIEVLLGSLSGESYGVAVEVARLPESIRGFGVVKDQAIADARERRARLLGRLTQSSGR